MKPDRAKAIPLAVPPPARAQGQMGRADLLRLLHAMGADAQKAPARLALAEGEETWFGYERQADVVETTPLLPTLTASNDLKPPSTQVPGPAAPVVRHRARLFGVVDEVHHAPQPEKAPPPEQWRPDLSQPRTPGFVPDTPPLIPWPRFHPILHRALRRPRPAGIDWPALARAIAERQWPAQPPQQQLPGWRDRLIVLMDHGPAMQPYRQDMEQLCAWLLHWRGSAGLEILHLPYGPQGPWVDGLHPDPLNAPTERPRQRFPQGAQVLLISEFGQLAPADAGAERWRILLHHLRRAGCDITALCPMHPVRLTTPDKALAGLPALCWNPGAGPKPRRFNTSATSYDNPPPLHHLLALISVFRRVDPPLLRALRRLLPDTARDAGLEGAAWSHPDLLASGNSRSVDPRRQADHLRRFTELVGEPPSPGQHRALPAQLLALWRVHHGALNRGLEHEEALRLAAHLPAECHDLLRQAEEEARSYFARLSTAYGATLRRYARDLTEFADPATLRRHSTWLGPVYRLAHGDLPQTLPEGLAHGDVLPPPGEAPESWLVQQGGALIWQARPPGPGQSQLVGPIRSATLDLEHEGVRRVHRLTGEHTLARLEETPLHLRTGAEEWEIAELELPWWALEVGRNRHGIYALMPSLGEEPLRVSLPCEYLMGGALLELDAPSENDQWSRWSQHLDKTGPFIDLVLNGITQRLRWIPPGEFQMGSPDKEPERNDAEGPRHRVILTRGYWLADTACTQGLWEAVMGKNPSHFTGDPELPVEQVSWREVDEFLGKLSRLTGLTAELPSEAEWEYACRAGTQSPFWWGDRLTTAEANYNGNHPYHDGEKGEYWERTMPVKSFWPNPWGLWQMHGNVWEWCRDGMKPYGEGVEVDPEGPRGEEVRRALRGGSWGSLGGSLRAAYRDAYHPGIRNRGIGFRFHLRSPGQGPGGPGS